MWEGWVESETLSTRSYQQLQDEFARLKADVSPVPSSGFDPGSAGLRVLTTRENLLKLIPGA